MAKCKFCGKKAGFFQDSHESCRERVDSDLELLGESIANAVKNGSTFASMQPSIESAKADARLASEDVRLVMIRSADAASQKLAVEAPLSNEAFERLFEIFEGIGYDFTNPEIKQNRWFGYVSLAMSNILYQVLHGEIPYYDPVGRMFFQLGRHEQPVFSSGRVILAVYKEVSSRGLYQSVSLPVGAGMYYQVGVSSSRSSQTGLVPMDEGEMLFTNKAFYFSGQKSTFKISYDSILRLESFIDGFGVFQSHGSGKVFVPDYSGMDTGWFFYNLMTALTKLEQ